MTTVRAFVGHSFTQEDASVVSTFLKYFDQVKSVLPSFDWTHAQEAEPRELTAKVLSLIENTNTFIGICTRKERAVAAHKLSPRLWPPSHLQARSGDFEWKTSDWIIQEIGLAVGKGMSLILLLEEGCRRPGGLQGDIEFIPFSRSSPEKAFGPLLEMLKSLSPARSAAEPGSTEGPTEEAKESLTPPPSTVDEPQEDWDRIKYEHAFIWKIIKNDRDGAAAIDEAFLKTIVGDEDAKSEWEASKEIWQIRFGRGGSLQKLKELHATHSDNAEIANYLADAFSEFGNHLEAAKVYEGAAGLVTDDVARVMGLRASAAVEFLRAGRDERSKELLNEQRDFILKEPDYEYRFLVILKEVSGIVKDDDLEIAVMERMVEIRPDDNDTRFALAYKHSGEGNEKLALHHYLQIPQAQRSAITWNNLGVSFQNFSMPAKAVDAYETAAKQEETLAMSNLGYKYMQAGFLKEADAQFQRALQIEDFHRNVGEGVAALRDVPSEEDKTQKEVLEKAEAMIAFFKRLGGSLSFRSGMEGESTWKGPDCLLNMRLIGDEFRASGSYERAPNALLGVGLLKKTTQYKVEYKGKVVGRSIEGTVERTADGESVGSGLFSGLSRDNEVKFAMIVDENENVISVMEGFPSSPRFYKLEAPEPILISGAA